MAQRFFGLCGICHAADDHACRTRDSVTNGLRHMDCHLSNDVGRLGNEQEAKHKEVHQAAAMTVEAFDKKARATFEGQSSDRIAKINGPTKVIVLLIEIVVILKQLKDEMSADLTAFKKKGLDRRTNHQHLTKAKTEEIFVLTKSIEEKETSALKLEQSAKEVSQPRPTRPPPWRDKFRACQSGAKSEEQSHNRAESMLWLVSSYLEDKAASQEGVNKYHLCLSTPSNSLWDALEMKAWSQDKFMKVTSAKVSDEDGFLSNSMMTKANNTIMNERIIDRIVDVTVAMQRQVPTIQTVLETVENLQVQFLDRVVDMPIVMQQKRSPSRLCFSLASRQWRSVSRGACGCSSKKRDLHLVFYQRDVTDGMCEPVQGVQDCTCECTESLVQAEGE